MPEYTYQNVDTPTKRVILDYCDAHNIPYDYIPATRIGDIDSPARVGLSIPDWEVVWDSSTLKLQTNSEDAHVKLDC